jgi:hypothetical protein
MEQEEPELKDTEPVDAYVERLRHHNKMTELEFERKTEIIKHQNAQERHRIENAETRKRDEAHFEREKDLIRFRKEHWNKK